MSVIVEQTPLPSRHAVRTLIEGLIGRDLNIFDGDPVPVRSTNVFAVYVTGKLAVSAVVAVSAEGAARLGGAVGMLPRGGVDEAIEGKDLPGRLRDNCYQVLDELAGVFNTSGAPRVRLYEMYGPNGTLPGDVAAMAASAGRRIDVRFTIPGYGAGALSVVVR
jgi:hypothetical protein